MHNVLQSIATGDHSKVLMLVHVSPCEDDVAETVCSMSFAKRARGIESNRELPEVCFSNSLKLLLSSVIHFHEQFLYLCLYRN